MAGVLVDSAKGPGRLRKQKGPTPLPGPDAAARLMAPGTVSSRGRCAMTHSPAGSRIVVGVDGSVASDAAVRWAVREARLRHATVHLVSAYHTDFRQRAQYVPPSSGMTPREERCAAEPTELARRY